MNPADSILDVAEEVAALLKRHHIDAIVIGGVALAEHHYVRHTDDIDLAVNADVPTLRRIERELRKVGYVTEFREPDADNPLGGVIDITGDFGVVQIISFADRFPAIVDDALREATMVVEEGSLLRIVPVPHLVALKLYAGGFKSKADIVELLSRNPDVRVEDVRRLCATYRLSGFDELMTELGGPDRHRSQPQE